MSNGPIFDSTEVEPITIVFEGDRHVTFIPDNIDLYQSKRGLAETESLRRQLNAMIQRGPKDMVDERKCLRLKARGSIAYRGNQV